MYLHLTLAPTRERSGQRLVDFSVNQGVEVRKFVVLLATLCVGMVTTAQGVRWEPVTADDLLSLYQNLVAVEVDVPSGATTFSLAYGSTSDVFVLSTFLEQGGLDRLIPDRLRIVVLLPDPAVVSPCSAEQAQATIAITPISGQLRAAEHVQKVCVNHPDRSTIRGRTMDVFEGASPTMGGWTPLLFQAWLVGSGANESGGVASGLDLEMNFAVQVAFGSGTSTERPEAQPLTATDFAKLPAIADLIAQYGVVNDAR